MSSLFYAQVWWWGSQEAPNNVDFPAANHCWVVNCTHDPTMECNWKVSSNQGSLLFVSSSFSQLRTLHKCYIDLQGSMEWYFSAGEPGLKNIIVHTMPLSPLNLRWIWISSENCTSCKMWKQTRLRPPLCPGLQRKMPFSGKKISFLVSLWISIVDKIRVNGVSDKYGEEAKGPFGDIWGLQTKLKVCARSPWQGALQICRVAL